MKYHPYLPDSQIVKLIRHRRRTIDSIRERSHWNIANIKPKDPVLLGLCMQMHLDAAVAKFRPADATPIDMNDEEDDAA